MDLGVDQLGAAMRQEFVDVADARAGHHALHRDAVPPRELDLEVPQQLDLQFIGAGTAWGKLAVPALAREALVAAVGVWDQKALPQAGAGADAGHGCVGEGLRVIDLQHLVVTKGEHAVALRDKVVDQLHLPYLQVLLQLVPVDDPVEVREAALVVEHDARQGQHGHGWLGILDARVLAQEDLDDLLERLEHDVGVLLLSEQRARRLLLGGEGGVGRHTVEHEPGGRATAVCGEYELLWLFLRPCAPELARRDTEPADRAGRYLQPSLLLAVAQAAPVHEPGSHSCGRSGGHHGCMRRPEAGAATPAPAAPAAQRSEQLSRRHGAGPMRATSVCAS
mmetsp:Transcript_36147/g.112451  ORF Transcript_36147/g.112451 Transcript_36147/m.112451 type:complete len:336 (+) Transcript_36147:1170-2177(+)